MLLGRVRHRRRHAGIPRAAESERSDLGQEDRAAARPVGSVLKAVSLTPVVRQAAARDSPRVPSGRRRRRGRAPLRAACAGGVAAIRPLARRRRGQGGRSDDARRGPAFRATAGRWHRRDQGGSRCRSICRNFRHCSWSKRRIRCRTQAASRPAKPSSQYIGGLPHDASLLFLVSGGASSLVERLAARCHARGPAAVSTPGRCLGRAIDDVNAVRRAISTIKGGGLARLAGSRRSLALMSPTCRATIRAVIGSGLLHAARESRALPPIPQEIAEIVRRANLRRRHASHDSAHPASCRRHAERRMPGCGRLRRVTRPGVAPVASPVRGRRHGARPPVRKDRARGQASDICMCGAGKPRSCCPPIRGRGGRNQHLALAAALELGRRGGRGPAVGRHRRDRRRDGGCRGHRRRGTVLRGRTRDSIAGRTLECADSGAFLEASGDLLHTGPTLTNVGDLVLGLRMGPGGMTLRALIVSDRADYRQLLAHHVTLEWRDALPAEYEPSYAWSPAAWIYGCGLRRRAARSRGPGRPRTRVARGPQRTAVLPAHRVFRAGCRRGVVGSGAALRRGACARTQGVRACADRRSTADAQWPAVTTCSPTRRAPRSSRCRPTVSAPCASAAIAACAASRWAVRRACSWPKARRPMSSACSRSSGRCPTSSRAARHSTGSCASTSSSRTCEHPNIVRIYDIGVADDHLFLAMEYFPGGDLRARMKQSMPWQEALGYLRQMAAALGALHEVGVLHRDVKPGNLLMREDGSVGVHRLRPGAAAGTRERHHRHRHDLRHAALHEPGTGPRLAARRAQRPVQPRRSCCTRC